MAINVTEDTVREALSFISADCDYSTWCNVGMALKSGGYDVSLFDEWSKTSGDKYHPGEPLRKWKSFKRQGISMGTLFFLAKQNGYSGACYEGYVLPDIPRSETVEEDPVPICEEYVLPDLTAKIDQCHDALMNNPEKLKYLTETRKIPVSILNEYKVGYSAKGFNDVLPDDHGRIKDYLSVNYKTVFPFIDSKGECHYFCGEIEDRSKKYKSGRSYGKYYKPDGIVQPVFNSRYFANQQIRLIFITEGLYDAWSVEAVRYPCMSLFGVGHKEFINDLTRYQVSKDRVFIISLDGDKTGRSNSESFKADLDRLGYFSVIHHFTGGKDANEAWCTDPEGFKTEVQETASQATALFLTWLSKMKQRKQIAQEQTEQYDSITKTEEDWNSLLCSSLDMNPPGKNRDSPLPGTADPERDLGKYHKWSAPDTRGKCRPLDILDLAIVKDIMLDHDMFLLNGKLYLYENGYYKIDMDNTVFKEIAMSYIYPELVTDQRLTRVINLLKAQRSIRIENADRNKHPKHWVNFRNGFLDLKTLSMHPHDPKYRSVVQIPHDWKPEHDPSRSVTEKFLKGIFNHLDDMEMFLEFVGLSMTTDMHFQKLMILQGSGGLGKSVLLRMAEWAIGTENISGLTLQNLNERFDTAFLYGKILNLYADLSSEDMKSVSGIKTITGQDQIRAEYKNGDIFFFHPDCKLLFSANKIPASRDDQTDAYYRRLLILPITHRAPEVPDLEEKLQADIDSFISLCVAATRRMYLRGSILESENSKRKVEELYYNTDSVIAFIKDRCIVGADKMQRRDILYERYKAYCFTEGRRELGLKSFYQNLRDKGFSDLQGHNGYYFFHGLELDKNNWNGEKQQ